MGKSTLIIVLASLNFALVSPDLFERCSSPGVNEAANCAQYKSCLQDVGDQKEGGAEEQTKINNCIDSLGLGSKTVGECTGQLRMCVMGGLELVPNRYLIAISVALFYILF